jgi:hypothetical protein
MMLWSQFSVIFANFQWKKICVFLKNQCYDHFFQQNYLLFESKNAIFGRFFCEIKKIITSVQAIRFLWSCGRLLWRCLCPTSGPVGARTFDVSQKLNKKKLRRKKCAQMKWNWIFFNEILSRRVAKCIAWKNTFWFKSGNIQTLLDLTQIKVARC